MMQLYLQIDRGISATNFDTQETVRTVGSRFEN